MHGEFKKKQQQKNLSNSEDGVSEPPVRVESLPATVGGSPLYGRLGKNSAW